VNTHEPVVFIVDDDPAVLKSLTALVSVVFPRVKTFGSAADFLSAYTPGHPGCLILDVAMPGMNGLELHRKMIREKIDLPVVFITGHGNIQMAVNAIHAGAVNFLEKPFHEQELWDSISKALAADAKNRQTKARLQSVEDRLAQLTEGERVVLNLIIEGKLNKEIAAKLEVSMRTIEDRRARLMKKMEARSIAELVRLVVGKPDSAI
jgi:two-component system, LuxR family, response regulator FixJ